MWVPGGGAVRLLRPIVALPCSKVGMQRRYAVRRWPT